MLAMFLVPISRNRYNLYSAMIPLERCRYKAFAIFTISKTAKFIPSAHLFSPVITGIMFPSRYGSSSGLFLADKFKAYSEFDFLPS